MAWEGKQKFRAFAGREVQLGDTLVPGAAQYIFTGEKGAPDATLTFEIRDGRPECTEISIKTKPDGRGIRSADLAMVHLDNLTTAVFAQFAEGQPSSRLFSGPQDEETYYRAERDISEARSARRGAVTSAELEDVARIYRDHITASPTRAVAVLLGYTERTAARRVQQARAAGLLPKTTPGKRKA
jgi:hypothetical protein